LEGGGGRGKEGEGGKGWRKGKGRKADAIVLENRQTAKAFFQFRCTFFLFSKFPFQLINGFRMNPTA
jgi:hypothetical protein